MKLRHFLVGFLVVGTLFGQPIPRPGLTSVPQAQTIIVDAAATSTGVRGDISKPYSTLNAANTAMLDGDTVEVRAGTYAITPFTISKNKVTFRLDKGAKVVPSATTSSDLITITNVDGVTIDGGEFDGQRSGTNKANGKAIAIGAGSSVTSNTTIKNGDYHGFGATNTTTIFVQKKTNHTTIIANTLHDNFCDISATVGDSNTANGWYDLKILYNTLTDGTVTDGQSGGIKYQTGTTNHYVPGLLIEGNYINTTGAVAIENTGGGIDGARIISNFVYNCPFGISLNTSTGGIVEFNELYGNNYNLEAAGEMKDTRYSNNYVDGRDSTGTVVSSYCFSASNTPAPDGIELDGNTFKYAASYVIAYLGSNARIHNNKIVAATGVGAILINQNNNQISNNDFIREGNGDLITINTTTSGDDSNIIKGNRFFCTAHVTSGRIINLYTPGTNNVTNLILKDNWTDGTLVDAGWMAQTGAGSVTPTYAVIGNTTSYSDPTSTTHSFGANKYVGLVDAQQDVPLPSPSGTTYTLPRGLPYYGSISTETCIFAFSGTTSSGVKTSAWVNFTVPCVATVPSSNLGGVATNPTTSRPYDAGYHHLEWIHHANGSEEFFDDQQNLSDLYQKSVDTPSNIGAVAVGDFSTFTPITDANLSLSNKPPVTLVANTNLTLSGAQTIDGVAGTVGTTLVLCTAQTTGSQNGPWIMQTGAWTRPGWYTPTSTTQAIQFMTTLVRLGSRYGGHTFRCTTANPIIIDSTATTWADLALADPTISTDPANKNYVDTAFAGLSPRTSSRMATTANIAGTYVQVGSGPGSTLTYTATGVQTVDGVTPALGDRILIKNQTTGAQNGIYTWTTLGATAISAVLTRASDYDQTAEVFEGTYTDVVEGTTNGETLWTMNASGSITIGTTAVTFATLQSSAGATIPSVTNLINGDGAGNGANSGIVPANVPVPHATTSDVTGTAITFADVTNYNFPVAANKSYLIYGLLLTNVSAGTNGIKISFSGPSSPTNVVIRVTGTTTSMQASSSEILTAFSSASTATYSTFAGDGYILIQGTIVNGANAGTVQLRMENASGSNTWKVYSGSPWNITQAN